jgi:hypothetical protein
MTCRFMPGNWSSICARSDRIRARFAFIDALSVRSDRRHLERGRRYESQYRAGWKSSRCKYAVQVNAISIAETDVGAFRQLRPADAADHVDTEAEDEENWDRRIEMEVGARNHCGDDQCDNKPEKLEHGTFHPFGRKERPAPQPVTGTAKTAPSM